MTQKFNNEELDVLFEFVDFVRRNSAIVTVNMMRKRMLYDFIHGRDESIELLNRSFYDVIETEELDDSQIAELAKILLKRECTWNVAGDDFEIEADQIAFDGHGYVILNNGDRIDADEFTYNDERERFNELRSERLDENPTRGKEFLN